jgi:hypothetical protein
VEGLEVVILVEILIDGAYSGHACDACDACDSIAGIL